MPEFVNQSPLDIIGAGKMGFYGYIRLQTIQDSVSKTDPAVNGIGFPCREIGILVQVNSGLKHHGNPVHAPFVTAVETAFEQLQRVRVFIFMVEFNFIGIIPENVGAHHPLFAKFIFAGNSGSKACGLI